MPTFTAVQLLRPLHLKTRHVLVPLQERHDEHATLVLEVRYSAVRRGVEVPESRSSAGCHSLECLKHYSTMVFSTHTALLYYKHQYENYITMRNWYSSNSKVRELTTVCMHCFGAYKLPSVLVFHVPRGLRYFQHAQFIPFMGVGREAHINWSMVTC